MKIKKDFFKIIFFVTVAVVIFFVINNIGRGYLIASSDNILYFVNNYNFSFPYIWFTKINQSFYFSGIADLFPIYLFFHFLSPLFTIQIIQLIYLFILYFGSFLSFFWMLGIFFNEDKNSYIRRAIPSFLYIFSVFLLPDPIQPRLLPVLLFFPIIFRLYHRMLKKYDLKNVIIIACISILYSGSNINVPVVVAFYLILFFYLIFFLFTEKLSKKEYFVLIKNHLILIFLFLFVNLWWIVNFIPSMLEVSAIGANVNSFRAMGSGFLYDHFRLLGSWAWYAGHDLYRYFPFSINYYKPILLVTTYFITIFSLLIILKIKNKKYFIDKDKKLYLFFFLLFVIGIFLSNGTKHEIGKVFDAIYNSNKLFWMFREPWAKFASIIVFSLPVLLYGTLSYFKQRINNKKIFYLLYGFVFACVVLNAYPFFTGEVIWTKWNGTMRTSLVKIPEYYVNIRNYIDENNLQRERISVFPYNFTYMGFNWQNGFFTAENPATLLLKNSTLRSTSLPMHSGDLVVNQIFDNLNNKNFNLQNYLSLLNTKYILQENDADWRYAGGKMLPPSESNKIIIEQNFKEIVSFGKFTNDYLAKIPNEEPDKKLHDELNGELLNQPVLILYRSTDNKKYLQQFYIPQAVITTSQDIKTLPEIVSQPDYQIRSAIYFNQQNLNIPDQLLNKGSIFTSLFDSAGKNQKENSFILNKYQANNIFILNKTNSPDSLVNVQYYPETQKLLIASLPAKGIFINDKEIDVKADSLLEIPSRVGDFLKIGENYFSIQKGYNKEFKLSEIAAGFKIYQVNPVNEIKLSNSSFEQGLWQKTPGDCSNGNPGEPDLNIQLSQNAADGKYSLELGSKNHFACTAKSFPINLKRNKVYKYSFDYKNVKGGKISYYYNLIGQSKSYQLSETINAQNHNWNHYETIIKPEEDISKIELYFYAPSNGTQEIINRYDNIELSEVKMNLINTYSIDQNKLTDNLVINNDIKLNEGNNVIEYRGDLEVDSALPQDLYNYYLEFNSKEIINTPITEFKKINPTKYRVIIHHATENFPLVFSESFHDGWKSYLVDYQKSAPNFNETDYKILDGNGDDQASAEELKNYINSGYISSLGNLKTETIKHVKWVDNREVFDYNENYKIDFVSKNFQDTIQNDNLASGRFYETWLSKPVDNNQNHLMVNGYANSWTINPGELCLNNAKCIKNADGSYDMELVIEFWPQRLFYIGLFISGMTLLGCLVYLGWGIVRRRKRKEVEVKKIDA